MMASVKPSRRALGTPGAQKKPVPSFSKTGRLLSAWVSIRPVGRMYTQVMARMPRRIDKIRQTQQTSAAFPKDFTVIDPEALSFFAHYSIASGKKPDCFPKESERTLNNSIKDILFSTGIFADFYLTIVLRTDTIRRDVSLPYWRLLYRRMSRGLRFAPCGVLR